MYFETLADFLAMGTHGRFVWSSYGLALLVVGINFVMVMHQRKQTLDTLRQKFFRQQHDDLQNQEDNTQ